MDIVSTLPIRTLVSRLLEKPPHNNNWTELWNEMNDYVCCNDHEKFGWFFKNKTFYNKVITKPLHKFKNTYQGTYSYYPTSDLEDIHDKEGGKIH